MASSAHATTWSAAGFLASHSLDQLIADQLLAAKPPTASELDHLKSLDRDQTLQLIVGGSSLPFHLELGEAVWAALSKLNAVKVASASELHGKFVQDGDAFTLAYGTLSTFFGGLQGLIGAPDAKLEQSMAREHLDSADSKLMFRTSNYGMDTSSELEFHFVVDPQTGQQLLGIDAYPVERAQAGQHYRRLLPPEHFAEELEAVNGRLDALGEPRMLREEFLAARLYTGPMFMKYNLVLRAVGSGSERLLAQMNTSCRDNRYVTTLHVINSSVVKLGKLMKATKVYRGIAGGVLPDAFWEPDEFDVCGGCEFGFMSCTTDRAVALEYAGSGHSGVGVVFEIQQGLVDRGADMSWLSQ